MKLPKGKEFPAPETAAGFRDGFRRGLKAGDTSSARMALAIAIAAADELNKGERDFLGEALEAKENARQAGESIALGQALRGIIAAELVELGADIEHSIVHRDDLEPVVSRPSAISQALDALDLVCQVCGDIVAWRHAAPGDHTGWVHLGNCIAQCHPKLDRDDYATPVVRMAVSA
jgi:hypothetical protein